MMSRAAFLLATILLAGCTSDEFIGDQSLADANGLTPITFSSGVPAVTRTDKSGADAADDLGNQFIVWGEKGTDEVATAPVDGNLVFPNYTVNYAASTAYTTTSNTKGWEYVGYKYGSGGTTTEFNYQNNITTKDGESAAVIASDAVQTIKYWDYGAAKYVFTAVSADKGDLAEGRVKIQKNTSGTTVYDKGYTITLAKVSDTYPSLDKLYFADRKVISSSNNADRTQTDTYGGNVTFRFRNLVSQVRAGVYETIPGYAISEIKFYVDNGSGEQTTEAQANSTSAFGAVCPNITATNYTGTLTVTYYSNTDGTSVENQPKITASGSAVTNLILGTNMSTINTSSLLGTTATAPTWDTNGGAFTKVLPQIGNSTNLKLKADYKLYNDITKEVIEVKGATAGIPAEYLQWKPNYKYTYLFKISDNTNGQTGTGGTPAGLYPITFDAVEVVAEDGQAEYITTVSEPSITTFGVKDGKYSAGKAEYEEGSDIYATFMEGSEVKELNLGTNVNVYQATTTDATNFPITEASVAEAIAETSSGTKKITVTNINSDASTYFTAAPAKVTTVPGEDGVNKDINALKLTGVKAGIYAIEYEASTAWTGDYKKVYKVIHVAAPVTP